MPLGSLLLRHLVPAPSVDAASVDASLERVWAAATARWPDVTLTPEQFVEYLAHRLPTGAEPTAAVEALCGEELYLACACVLGGPVALRHLEDAYITGAAAWAARRSAGPELLDELTQLLRTRLLVAEHGVPPRLASYTGRGALRVWMRMTATRLALDLRRQKHNLPSERSCEELLDAALPVDPAVAQLRTRHAGAFRNAFAGALAALPARDRTVLQLYYIRNMTADAISVLYGVNLRSVQRWVTQTQTKLLRATREALASTIGPTEDVESMMRVLQSQLHSVVAAHLGEKAAEPAPSDD